jgi:hypothetical protein
LIGKGLIAGYFRDNYIVSHCEMHGQEGSAVPTEPLSNGRYAANVRANATASIVDEMMRRALTETLLESQRNARCADRHRLKRPRLLWPAQEMYRPAAQSKAAANATPDARIEIIDSLHRLSVEESQRFSVILETFLREEV